MDDIFASRFEIPIRRFMNRVLRGDEITVNYKRKEAHFNYYKGDNTESVPMWYVQELINLQLIGCDSGNFETGERHYNFQSR